MSEKPNCEPQARPPLLSVETPNSGTFQMGSGKGKIPSGCLFGVHLSFSHQHTNTVFPLRERQEEKPGWGSKF